MSCVTQLPLVKTLYLNKEILKIKIIDTNRHDFKAGFYTVRKSSTKDETGQSSLKNHGYEWA